ncbi:hypothetical protein IPA_05760 [Ignicoccus pacificus DSM 13166]|uniref:Uncharacterized protein n=1 Tax=Ignicoccus pacificus DSM 13166 TaxID=940294 RepID=A0A977KBB2_9CREN|nr:hypothetical protein IPA_05760 [Ignicoccus pacificus DSM 13166]
MLEELLKNAYAKELDKCVVGIINRQGKNIRVLIRPLACYALYGGSLVDPWDTQIPLHRIHCLRCEKIRYEVCPTSEVPKCERIKGEWGEAIVCECGGGKVVRGSRGYDPVYALRGPPYPLVYSGQIVDCLPQGECEGFLERRGVWYWYY